MQKGPPRKLRSGEALKKQFGSKSSKGSQQLDISHQGDDNEKICGDDSSPEQDKSDDSPLKSELYSKATTENKS